MKKLITVSVPVYNEKENIRTAYERITAVMRELTAYDYEIVFFDDGSTDGSRLEIEALCGEDPRVSAVLYTRNFGYSKTVFYCMQQARGDAAVLVHCDLQNPPEEIPQLVEKWEQGADAVLGVKKKSRENKFVFFLRSLCYMLANILFGMRLIPHATEFELLDKSLLDVLRQIRTPEPFLRGLILEYARQIEKVYYVQDRRAAGKTHFSPGRYYDFAISGFVQTSRCLPRRLICFSLLGMLVWALELLIRFVPGAAGMPTDALWNGIVLRCCLFLLLLLMAITAILLEYVIAAVRNRENGPGIIEERRINF